MSATNKGFNENEYKREYGKANYDRVTVYFPKGDRDRIKRYTEYKGTTMNALIISLIEKDIADHCKSNHMDYDEFCKYLSTPIDTDSQN